MGNPPLPGLVSQEEVDGFVSGMQRDLNCLADPDRGTRKRALEKLQSRLLKGEKSASGPLLEEVWCQAMLPPLVRSLADPVEKCRELAVRLVADASKRLPSGTGRTLALLVPAVADRVASTPVAEPSEEVRLQLANLLADVLAPRSDLASLEGVVRPLVRTLCAELLDPFHEIKKAACRTVVSAAGRKPGGIFTGEHAGALLKSLTQNIGHSHLRVRYAVLQALGALVGSGGLPAGTVEDTLPPVLRPLACDRASNVRDLFFVSVASWLGCREDRDAKAGPTAVPSGTPAEDEAAGSGRVDATGGVSGIGGASGVTDDPRPFYPRLLPLLLLGVTDQSAEIATRALRLVEDVGETYLRLSKEQRGAGDNDAVSNGVEDMSIEGEDQVLREEGEDSAQAPQPLALPPPFQGRPAPAARRMVADLLPRLLPPLLRDLQEWTSASRSLASRVLHTTLVFAGGSTVRHLDGLLPTLCSAVADDEVAVAERIVSCTHTLGSYVAPRYWMPLMVDAVCSPRRGPGQQANELVLLAALLRATPPASLAEDLLCQLSRALLLEDVRCSDSPAVRLQLLSVILNTVRTAGPACNSVSLSLFLPLLQLQSVEDDPAVREGATSAIAELAAAIGSSGPGDLYSRHMSELLERATAGHATWTAHSPGRLLLQAVLRGAGERAGPYLAGLLPILSTCLQPERDPILRVGLLQLLDELFERPDLRPWWTPLAEPVIRGLLTPPAIWRIGKTAATVRFAAMATLGTLLRADLCSPAQLSSVVRAGELLPVLKTCLEEDYFVETRRAATQATEQLLRVARIEGLDAEQRRAIYPEILKRLDDSNDRVRIAACGAAQAFFEGMPPDYDDTNTGYFVTGLLVHMDDSDVSVQEAVCSALEIAAQKKPALVSPAVTAAKPRHRVPLYCDRLLAITARRDHQPSHQS